MGLTTHAVWIEQISGMIYEVCGKSPSEPEKRRAKTDAYQLGRPLCRIGRNIASTVNTDASGASPEKKGALSP
jgi:hypothetical protein